MTTQAQYVLLSQPKPRRLHRTDCWHPPYRAQYRKATRQELATVRVCQHCADRDEKEGR